MGTKCDRERLFRLLQVIVNDFLDAGDESFEVSFSIVNEHDITFYVNTANHYQETIMKGEK